MSMHMICNYSDETCMYHRMTIFDYVTRKFIYSGKYEHLEHVREFNGHALYKLAEPSLRLIDYEDSPFIEHIACLQSVININREEDMISFRLPPAETAETSSSASYSSAGEKTPEPIIKVKAAEQKE